MKLKFKIRKLPTGDGQIFDKNYTNIPLIYIGPPELDKFDTELWFLWDRHRLEDGVTKLYNFIYKYTKL